MEMRCVGLFVVVITIALAIGDSSAFYLVESAKGDKIACATTDGKIETCDKTNSDLPKDLHLEKDLLSDEDFTCIYVKYTTYWGRKSNTASQCAKKLKDVENSNLCDALKKNEKNAIVNCDLTTPSGWYCFTDDQCSDDNSKLPANLALENPDFTNDYSCIDVTFKEKSTKEVKQCVHNLKTDDICKSLRTSHDDIIDDCKATKPELTPPSATSTTATTTTTAAKTTTTAATSTTTAAKTTTTAASSTTTAATSTTTAAKTTTTAATTTTTAASSTTTAASSTTSVPGSGVFCYSSDKKVNVECNAENSKLPKAIEIDGSLQTPDQYVCLDVKLPGLIPKEVKQCALKLKDGDLCGKITEKNAKVKTCSTADPITTTVTTPETPSTTPGGAAALTSSVVVSTFLVFVVYLFK